MNLDLLSNLLSLDPSWGQVWPDVKCNYCDNECHNWGHQTKMSYNQMTQTHDKISWQKHTHFFITVTEVLQKHARAAMIMTPFILNGSIIPVTFIHHQRKWWIFICSFEWFIFKSWYGCYWYPWRELAGLHWASSIQYLIEKLKKLIFSFHLIHMQVIHYYDLDTSLKTCIACERGSIPWCPN